MGSVGGKALYTMMFSCGLMLAFLRDARTSQTTTRIFNMLQDVAGLEFFMTLFPAVLADNGPEFSNPKMIDAFAQLQKLNFRLVFQSTLQKHVLPDVASRSKRTNTVCLVPVSIG